MTLVLNDISELYKTSKGYINSFKNKKHVDNRGSLSKLFENNLPFIPNQILIQENTSIGIKRGMHFNNNIMYQESKIIYLLDGVIEWLIYDPINFELITIELSRNSSIHVPKGLYHGSLSKTSFSSVLILADLAFNVEYSTNVDLTDLKISNKFNFIL